MIQGKESAQTTTDPARAFRRLPPSERRKRMIAAGLMTEGGAEPQLGPDAIGRIMGPGPFTIQSRVVNK